MNEQILGVFYLRSFFSPKDCQKLINTKNQNNSSKVSVWADKNVPIFDNKKRSGTTAFITTLDLLNLELEKDIAALIVRLKHKYKIHPEPLLTSFQICEYGPGDHFDVWHSDDNHQLLKTKRRLTMVCLLSNNDDFEGGKLILNQLNPTDTNLKQGDIIFFPARQSHRVTEVTKGLRHTLVCWL